MCEQLNPEPICGVHGACHGDVCVCDSGWSQSAELAFVCFDRKNEDQEIVLKQLTCHTNETILYALYGLLLALSCLALFLGVVRITRKSQLRRAIRFIALILSVFFLAMLKLNDLQNLIGEDVAVTVAFAA